MTSHLPDQKRVGPSCGGSIAVQKPKIFPQVLGKLLQLWLSENAVTINHTSTDLLVLPEYLNANEVYLAAHKNVNL